MHSVGEIRPEYDQKLISNMHNYFKMFSSHSLTNWKYNIKYE